MNCNINPYKGDMQILYNGIVAFTNGRGSLNRSAIPYNNFIISVVQNNTWDVPTMVNMYANGNFEVCMPLSTGYIGDSSITIYGFGW